MYVGAYFDRKADKVFVAEIYNGKNVTQEYPAELYFYIEDPKGKYESVFGDRLTKMEYRKYGKFLADLKKYRKQGRRTYEGNVKPLFKTLEKYYKNQKKEQIKISFLDIEVEYDRKRGWSTPDDPFNRITAITLYNSWEETLYSMSLHPKGMSREQAERELEGIENNVICDTEEQLFTIFFELTKDTNVYATWNGEVFDIPMLINRSKRIMGNEAPKNFCLWNKSPVPRTIEKYGKEVNIYDLIGKVHLDMMELYRKYTYSEQPSYRLDYIGEIEVGEKKVEYQGTLDTLYNNDYRKFIEYARQDTMLLVKLNKKLDHINLAFTIAHENLVDIQTTMGAVALSDNAIVLEAHRRGLITRDRDKSNQTDTKIAGAWVADPKTGLRANVATVDLTSLYPSIFRTLNLGNETIVAQIEHTITKPLIEERTGGDLEKFAQAWSGIFWIEEVDKVFNKTDDILTLKIEDGETVELPAKDIYDFVFDNGFIITANGTIIRTDKESVVSSLLTRWFAERKQFQKRAKTYAKLVDGIKVPDDILEKLKGG